MTRLDPFQIFPTDAAERLQVYYERMTDPLPLRVTSKAEWLERRPVVRERVITALGLSPQPDRLPLDVRTGGTLQRDGYRVERIYWQTWPQVWASGWLYLPDEIEGKVPAVLNPHGHWSSGARHPNVQSRLISLARLGYIALAVDSEHLYDYPTGVTPLTVMTYNNLRALDYLTSRADVDRDRLGVVGESGGAQQAMYLMAVDDRIRVAVLAILVSHFRRILSNEGHHCACNHVPGVMRFTDEPELCGVPSPRALQFLTVTGDWTAEFPAHELEELRALYQLWGQPDRLDHRQFETPHDFTLEMREAAYTWLERELRGNRKAEPVAEPAHEVEDPESLLALDAPPAEHRGPDGILEWYHKRVVAQPPQIESKPSRRTYQERVRTEVRALLGEAAPVTLDTQWHAGERGEGKAGEWVANSRLVSFRSERDVRVPAVWLPGPGEGPWPALIAVHPDGKAAALRLSVVQGLHSQGYAVLAPDVRLRGELSREWLHNSILWGRPEAGMAVTDVLACVQWLYGREDVDVRSLTLLGEGDQGVVALLAAGLDERVTATIADCCETTYRDGGEGLPVIPNILRVADVPQIASLVAPRPLWLYRVPEDRVGFASRRYYDWTNRSYQSLGDRDALKMAKTPLPDPYSLHEWLHRRIRRAKR
jgi:cephalosporin-C deacetylase-like acetyl esterase